MANTKELTLPSGAKATIAPFKGRHVKEAMKHAGDGAGAYDIVFSLISMLVTINGQRIVPEQMDDMDGMDVMMLVAEFSGDNFRNA
jgi:hypothetical protein